MFYNLGVSLLPPNILLEVENSIRHTDARASNWGTVTVVLKGGLQKRCRGTFDKGMEGQDKEELL